MEASNPLRSPQHRHRLWHPRRSHCVTAQTATTINRESGDDVTTKPPTIARFREDTRQDALAAATRLHHVHTHRSESGRSLRPLRPTRPLGSAYHSTQAIAQASPDELTALLSEVSDGAWTRAHADALQRVAWQLAASTRAVDARAIVVCTMVRHLLDLYARLAELEAAIAAVLADDEDRQRLRTLLGVGPSIAATVRAALGDVTRFHGVDQVIAAGLDPRIHQSGAFMGQKHLSKHGPRALRHALHLATLNAVRNRVEWTDRYHRLLDCGRSKKEALIILSRAYLKVVYHVLRTDVAYDPLALTAPKPSPARGRAWHPL